MNVPGLWAVLLHLFTQGCQACDQGLSSFQVVKSLLIILQTQEHCSHLWLKLDHSVTIPRERKSLEARLFLKARPTCRLHDFCLHTTVRTESCDHKGNNQLCAQKEGRYPPTPNLVISENTPGSYLSHWGVVPWNLQTPCGQGQCVTHLGIRQVEEMFSK